VFHNGFAGGLCSLGYLAPSQQNSEGQEGESGSIDIRFLTLPFIVCSVLLVVITLFLDPTRFRYLVLDGWLLIALLSDDAFSQ
jgi:hypothetical protein